MSLEHSPVATPIRHLVFGNAFLSQPSISRAAIPAIDTAPGFGLRGQKSKVASIGVATAPVGADLSVTARSANVGDAISAGSTRYYQTCYRDPIVQGGCVGTITFNVTQGLSIPWLP